MQTVHAKIIKYCALLRCLIRAYDHSRRALIAAYNQDWDSARSLRSQVWEADT